MNKMTLAEQLRASLAAQSIQFFFTGRREDDTVRIVVNGKVVWKGSQSALSFAQGHAVHDPETIPLPPTAA